MMKKQVSVFVAALFVASCAEDGPSAPRPVTVAESGGEGVQRQAAIIAALGAQEVDRSLRTHVFFVGYAKDAGELFYRSAVASALRVREAHPNDQILLLRGRETGLEKDVTLTRRNGVRVLEADLSKWTGERLLAYLDGFGKLASVSFHGHSSAWSLGLEIDGGSTRLGTDTPGLARLADNFTSDGYASLNGCNNGLALAPKLAEAWDVMVTGVAGSADFQQLHVDGAWYFNNPGQAPAGGWATSNAVSFDSPLDCRGSSCVRMKPDNAPYRGYWGNFDGGGLPFAKAFCPASMEVSECERRMALSLLAFPSVRDLSRDSPREAFDAVVRDFLCPISSKTNLRGECESKLDVVAATGEPVVYSPFRGNTLECTFAGCDARLVCDVDSDGDNIPGTCKMNAPTNRSPRTLAREYLHYMRGFERLKRGADPTPTPTPTARPTVVPTVRPTVVPTVRPTVVPTVRPTVVPTIVPTLTPIDTALEPITMGVRFRTFTIELRRQRTYRASEWIEIPGFAEGTRHLRSVQILSGDQLVAEALPNIIDGRFLLRARLPAGNYRLTFRTIENGAGQIVAMGRHDVTVLPE